MYNAVLKNYFKEHQEELLSDVRRLVEINSERLEAEEGMPFGRGAAHCLDEAESMLRGYGFKVKNYDHYVVTADLGPEERTLDILAHLDVVPAGDGWKITEPFVMKCCDGRIYGRGTADDKGPALCALYAMRAIKELDIPLFGGVRLILGSDEECGSEDLDYYYETEPPAQMSFSPDADFPLINIEKGGLHSGFSSQMKTANNLPRVLSIKGGTKGNVVADYADTWLEGISRLEAERLAARFNAEYRTRFSVEEREGKIYVCARGETAHASTPEAGENAVTAILAYLAELPLFDDETHRKIKALNKLFPHGDYYGKALGVDIEDARSGRTTLSLNILSYDGEQLEGRFDLRASIEANDENTTEVIKQKLKEAGLTPEEGCLYKPHIVDESSTIVKGLLKAYSEITGEEGKPIAIGGGTYVHGIENGVAFGCAKEGIDNRMHGADEFMEIEQMLISCEIFAQAIINLCGPGMEK